MPAQMPPSPIALPQRAPSAKNLLFVLKDPVPPRISKTNATTLIPIRIIVACAAPDIPPLKAGLRICVFSPAHSGQRIPTEVGVMQSGQIGRPQREQETPVSRSGWR